MYSNLAGLLLNSVPVLPSSAKLAELGRVLRIPAGLLPVLQELGGDWKVLVGVVVGPVRFEPRNDNE